MSFLKNRFLQLFVCLSVLESLFYSLGLTKQQHCVKKLSTKIQHSRLCCCFFFFVCFFFVLFCFFLRTHIYTCRSTHECQWTFFPRKAFPTLPLAEKKCQTMCITQVSSTVFCGQFFLSLHQRCPRYCHDNNKKNGNRKLFFALEAACMILLIHLEELILEPIRRFFQTGYPVCVARFQAQTSAMLICTHVLLCFIQFVLQIIAWRQSPSQFILSNHPGYFYNLSPIFSCFLTKGKI